MCIGIICFHGEIRKLDESSCIYLSSISSVGQQWYSETAAGDQVNVGLVTEIVLAIISGGAAQW